MFHHQCGAGCPPTMGVASENALRRAMNALLQTQVRKSYIISQPSILVGRFVFSQIRNFNLNTSCLCGIIHNKENKVFSVVNISTYKSSEDKDIG